MGDSGGREGWSGVEWGGVGWNGGWSGVLPAVPFAVQLAVLRLGVEAKRKSGSGDFDTSARYSAQLGHCESLSRQESTQRSPCWGHTEHGCRKGKKRIKRSISLSERISEASESMYEASKSMYAACFSSHGRRKRTLGLKRNHLAYPVRLVEHGV